MLSAVPKDRVITQFPQVTLLAQEYLRWIDHTLNLRWISHECHSVFLTLLCLWVCMHTCIYVHIYTHTPMCLCVCVCVYTEWTQLQCCSTAMHIFIPSAVPPGCQPLQEHGVPPQGQSCLRREPHRKGRVSEAQFHWLAWHISQLFCVHVTVLTISTYLIKPFLLSTVCGKGRRWGVGAVSYTHLTLPTMAVV